MGFTFKFYKHKHLFRLKENWKNIGAHVLYCSSEEAPEPVERVEEEKKKDLGEDGVPGSDSCRGHGDITYPEIVNTIQYSSICISVFNKQKEVAGIISLDYELCAGSFGKRTHERIPLCDIYNSVSLHIKEHSVMSSLSRNNSLIINLVMSKHVNYLDDLCSYVFYTFEDIVFILLFLQKNKKKKNEEYFSCEKMNKCLHIDVKEHLKMDELPYDRIVLFCRYSYTNKIYLRPTCSSDVYDLHELLRKYSLQNGGEENHYLIYNLIERKTEEDILLSILNNKKKIIGFVWLKKNIDVNILVRLYNLKAYNYLLRREFFQDIVSSLVPFSEGTKNLNKKKKKYMFIQFKQFILSQISIKSEADLEKKHEIGADVIYGYLMEHLMEDVEEYAAYFVKKDLDTRVILRNIYSKLQYDYENCTQDQDNGRINFALMNKLINLCANISYSDIAQISAKFQSHFDKVEMLYYNFNTDKTYKKIYDKIWRKKAGIKTDEGGEHDAKKINIIKLNCDNSGTSKSGKNSKDVVNLSYFDIFLLLQNIYPEIFKKNEIILLFLFLELYELITVEESTPFDCVSFKLYLDELVDIKKNYFICKYKHMDWLSSLSDKDKNAFSLNLFILNEKYHHHCKDVLLKIEKYYDQVDYVVATNNERGKIPLILNYFNRVKKKKKTNTLESLYVLNKYTLFLPPCTDYMRMTDIEDVQKLLESVREKEKEPINRAILSLKEFYRRGVGHGEEAPSELKFYRTQNYYIFVTRCGGKVINVTAGCILNNIDFYYKLKAFDFKDIILRNENCEEKHFLLSFFLSIIIFKFYDKRIVHNILGMTKACSCQINVGDNSYSDIYKHFKFLFMKDNSVNIYKKQPPIGVETTSNYVGSQRPKSESHEKFYLVMTKQMCLKKFTNIDHNIVFWGINDVCLSVIYKLMKNNVYFFNNVIIISPYINQFLEGTTTDATEQDDYQCNTIKNCSLENVEMYKKLSNLMIKERVKIIHDNIFSIDRENKKIELNNSVFIFYDYLFICFDKEDISTYSFQLNSYEMGKKKNFNFIERNKSSACPNERFDFLTKAKDYEKFESTEWPAKDRSVGKATPRRGKYGLNRGKRQHVDSPTLHGRKNALGETNGGKDRANNMYNPEIGDPSSSSDSSEGDITGVAHKGMIHGKVHHELRGEPIGGINPTGELRKTNDEEEYHSDYSSLSSRCIETSETSLSEGEAEDGDALEMVDTNDYASYQEGGRGGKRGNPIDDALHREKSLSGGATLNKGVGSKGELLSEGKKRVSKMVGKVNNSDRADKAHNSDDTRTTQMVKAAARPPAERKNVEGVFSISDPFLDKYFDKNSTYMTVVKNCVSYIVIYSDNMDILTVVNFFLKNGVKSYKLLIISPHTCTKCSEKNLKNNLKEKISKHRVYYEHKKHLKENYIISDQSFKKNSYHKNCVPDNIKHVLNKVFVLFHFLKIRIIQGEIIAIKKNKQNRLKHVVVRFCKHAKVDSTLVSSQKFLFKNTVLIPCRVLLCSYVFNISNHLHYVLNKASIVYNDRICVNHKFQTNDKFIFSAGELCAFSSKYRIGKENILNHEQYNGTEIGNLVSKRFLSIIIENVNKPCDLSGSSGNMRGANQGGKDQHEERCQDGENYTSDDVMSPVDLYRKLKVFEKPIIHFSCLPCDFYFYHFQAPTGDLCKFHEPRATGHGSICTVDNADGVDTIGGVNATGKEVTEGTNLANVYKVAFLTDTLKICMRRDMQISERFKVKHFEVAKNISTEGYYCRVTTNSLNLINSFTYLGRQKLNFHNLHKLCNMSINYFYTILKNIRTSPDYDILSLLSEEREKSIFHYKFQMFREKLKTKLMHLPLLKNSIQANLQGVKDAESFRKYVREKLFLEDGPMTDIIKEKVETHLIEYIKENHELLNGYYLPG